MFRFIADWFKPSRYPIPKKDATWIGYCPQCKDYELLASKGGYRNGGIEHCFTCGFEKETIGHSEESMKYSIWLSENQMETPYDWHFLTEGQKWKELGMNKHLWD
jgi:hypothetical protein